MDGNVYPVRSSSTQTSLAISKLDGFEDRCMCKKLDRFEDIFPITSPHLNSLTPSPLYLRGFSTRIIVAVLPYELTRPCAC